MAIQMKQTHRNSGLAPSFATLCQVWASTAWSHALLMAHGWDQLRRSACQTPEQAPLPPLQEPPPVLAARRPVPVAVLSPAATFTITAPFFSTLPVMVTVALPALPRLPLVLRIG